MKNFIQFSSANFATKWVSGFKDRVHHALVNHALAFVKRHMDFGSVGFLDTKSRCQTSDENDSFIDTSLRKVDLNESEARMGNDGHGEEDFQSRCVREFMEDGNRSRKGKYGDKKKQSISTKSANLAKMMDETTEEIHAYLTAHFELRYNVLTEQTEYRPIGGRLNDFKPMDQRQVNTLCIEIRRDGINCWDRDLVRYLNSAFVSEYHPFRLYLDELPAWDGVDRLRNLAERVAASDYWVKAFHRWMLGMTAQWMGMEQLHANSVAPLLVSQQQGWQKSTFCKSLVPKPLLGYYTDQLNLASSATEIQLSLMGLINLDEFDRISSNKMAQLKNLMQLSSLNIRKAYKKNFQRLPRIASFIGTSNRRDLLTDPTGSRRFICVDVDGPINCGDLNLDQIYAQLKSELLAGERFWFTHEEEFVIQQHNAGFYRMMPEEEIFRVHFRTPKEHEPYELLSLADILETMRTFHKGLMHNLNLAKFGSALVATGVERVHTIDGNRYKVVRIS